MKITPKNLGRAWNRALLILYDTHPALARSLEGQDPALEDQSIVFTCGMSIADRMAVRLAIREAYGELGADVASIIRANPAWPAVDTCFPEELLREPETRVSEMEKADDYKREVPYPDRGLTRLRRQTDQGEELCKLKRMSRWLNVRAEIDKAFAQAEEPIEFTQALREFLEDPTDWESRLPVLIYAAIDRSLSPAE